MGQMITLPLSQKLQSFNSVAAGQTASLRLEIGYTYKTIYVVYAGITLAQMTAIRLKANGNTIRDFPSGADLDKMNQFDTMAAANGILAIPLERFRMSTRVEREYTAIGTGMPYDPNPTVAGGARNVNYNPVVISTLQLEIDIDAAASAPVLSAYTERDQPSPTGRILKLERYNIDVTAVGDRQI
ncbi:MAG TPA: major capsid protein P2, partial [Candidatus Acidoferrum sp.]|nr:major capsid protein P2 [Candidatus Acidoferrum sp.]